MHANQTLKAVGPSPGTTLPCAHHPGKEVLVCVAGHTNVKGTVEAVRFSQNGYTSYDVLVDESSPEPLLLRDIVSWRVAGVPDGYNGTPTANSVG